MNQQIRDFMNKANVVQEKSILFPKRVSFQVQTLRSTFVQLPNRFPPSHFVKFQNRKESYGANLENINDKGVIRRQIH